MSSSQKKVILRRFLGDVMCGYLPASGFVERGEIHLLNLHGRIAPVPLGEVKTVCYVRDFNLTDGVNPERLQRRSFVARPRGDGLWVRLTFREDDDRLEGLAAADLSLLDGLAVDAGVFLLPPDTRTNTQRIYVPHLALATMEVLAVITSPSKRNRPAVLVGENVDAGADLELQKPLFDGAPGLITKRGRYGKR